MKNEEKIVELLSELVNESQITREEVTSMKGEITSMKKEIKEIQHSQNRNIAAIGELRLSMIKLSERIELVFDHEKRIQKLEKKVFN
ncbi:MAG TPA: hypothetical protein ACFCUD_03925 [Cyclobacteriaceae bacterium]